MVSRMATVPNAALARMTLESSFARLRSSMARFNAERGPSRPLCRCELSVMVEKQGSHEKGMRS